MSDTRRGRISEKLKTMKLRELRMDGHYLKLQICSSPENALHLFCHGMSVCVCCAAILLLLQNFCHKEVI